MKAVARLPEQRLYHFRVEEQASLIDLRGDAGPIFGSGQGPAEAVQEFDQKIFHPGNKLFWRSLLSYRDLIEKGS